MQFCGSADDVREHLHTPCVMDGYVYATDGWAIIKAPLARTEMFDLPDNPRLEDLVRRRDVFAEQTMYAPGQLRLPPKAVCPDCGGDGKVFALEKLVQAGVLLRDMPDWSPKAVATPEYIHRNWMGPDGVLLNVVAVYTENQQTDDFDDAVEHPHLVIPPAVWDDPANWVDCPECRGAGVRHAQPDEYGDMPSMFADVHGYPVAVPLLAKALDVLGDVVAVSVTAVTPYNDCPPLLLAAGGVSVAIMGVRKAGIEQRWDAVTGKLYTRVDAPDHLWQEVAP